MIYFNKNGRDGGIRIRDDGVARADGNAELRRSFEKDVQPKIGAKPVKSTTEHELRALLREMVKRGVECMATVFVERHSSLRPCGQARR